MEPIKRKTGFHGLDRRLYLRGGHRTAVQHGHPGNGGLENRLQRDAVHGGVLDDIRLAVVGEHGLTAQDRRLAIGRSGRVWIRTVQGGGWDPGRFQSPSGEQSRLRVDT
jgi:hypothetical protein